MSVCRLLQWFLTGYVVESAIYAIVFIFSNLRVRIMLNNIGLAARKCTEPTVKLPFEYKIESNSQDWNYTWENLISTLCWNLTDTQACLICQNVMLWFRFLLFTFLECLHWTTLIFKDLQYLCRDLSRDLSSWEQHSKCLALSIPHVTIHGKPFIEIID